MKILMAFIVIVFMIAGGVMFYVGEKEKDKLAQDIKDLQNRRDQSLRLDSLSDAITKHIVDSIRGDLIPLNNDIKMLTKDLNETHKQNDQMQKKLNDIVIAMPEL